MDNSQYIYLNMTFPQDTFIIPCHGSPSAFLLPYPITLSVDSHLRFSLSPLPHSLSLFFFLHLCFFLPG